MKIIETKDYEIWFDSLTAKNQAQVMKRLRKIQTDTHFGDTKNLSNGLFELRWKNGWRVYFIRISSGIILLVGGHKNEQEKNIKKARITIHRYTYN